MLFVVDETGRKAAVVDPDSFSELGVRERFDLQEWVLAAPQLLGEELLIITAEFDRFDRTAERIDVLAMDRNGKLVIGELKRTAVGTRADLQALRYAAYCSTLTIDDAAELFAAHVRQREKRDITTAEATEEVLAFVQDPDFEELDEKPRIILAAEEFPPEMTATLLWLRSFEVDISAVRVRPYRLGEQIVVDSQVLIPLPEAKDFIVRREKKEGREAARVKGKGLAYRSWFQIVIDELRETHDFTNARVAQPQNWYSFSSGVRGVVYSVVFSQGGLRAEVYLDTGSREENKALFDRLLERREALEAACGEELVWERLDNRRAARIYVHHGAHIEAEDEVLTAAREWAIEAVLRLRQVFADELTELTGVIATSD